MNTAQRIMTFFISYLLLTFLNMEQVVCNKLLRSNCNIMILYCQPHLQKKIKKLFYFVETEEQLRTMDGMLGLSIIRKSKGYSQQKVAMDLNISREAISYYENGKRCPDIEMLRKLSAYFNVSIDFLINGREFSDNRLEQ